MRVTNKRRAVGLTRHRSLQVTQRDAALLPRIPQRKAEHPCWGSRSMWASLHFVEQQRVHTKRVLRLMRAHDLVVAPNLPLKAKRTPTRSTPRPTKPHAWWGLEMTQVLVEGFGWVYLVLVLAWYTKKIVGYDAGVPCTARQWLAAVDMAVNRQCLDGARGQGVFLMRDHGGQPTAVAFREACTTLGMQHTCTSDHNPKSHADTERMMRTLKAEGLWLQAWTSPYDLMRAFETWIASSNNPYLHSALDYKTPRPFELDYQHSHCTPFVAA